MARLDRLAYARAMRASKNAQDGSAAVVYHTVRHRWLERYKARKAPLNARG